MKAPLELASNLQWFSTLKSFDEAAHLPEIKEGHFGAEGETNKGWSMSLTVETFPVNPFAMNAYLIYDETGEGALIDPAVSTEIELKRITDRIDALGLTITHLLLTHGHIDHVLGNARVRPLYPDAPFYLHPADAPLVARLVQQGQMFGLAIDGPAPPVERDLSAGDVVTVGRTHLEVRHVPGHSPGSVAFYSAADGVMISGDALFKGSVGRTDLWLADHDTLIGAIRSQLLTLPDATIVYPGHGPATTVGAERQSNPFLRPER